jgi:hypothetical protein
MRLPLAPLTVRGYVPAAVPAATVKVRVLAPLVVIEAGAKPAVTPLGKPFTESATSPVNPLCAPTVTV